MKQYIIKGGTPLSGEVTIGGAKNAALGIIVAAIMADEPVTIDNLPDVDDVRVLSGCNRKYRCDCGAYRFSYGPY